jgi:hypothetical protein
MASATRKNNNKPSANNSNKPPANNKSSAKSNNVKLNVTKYLNRGTNLKFRRTNSGWNVVGKSAYNWKDNVKALGATWQKNIKTWKLSKEAKLGPLRKILATLKKVKETKAKENKKKPVNVTKHLDKGTDVNITKEGTTWVINGRSAYDWKEEIKALGGRWNGDRRVWEVSIDKTVAPLRHMLAKLRAKHSAEKYKKDLATFDPKWRCCEKMKVYSFTSGHCPVHCAEGSIIAPHGRCYTGD